MRVQYVVWLKQGFYYCANVDAQVVDCAAWDGRPAISSGVADLDKFRSMFPYLTMLISYGGGASFWC